MLTLKACPRCVQGDLLLQQDSEDGVADWVCLQCGYHLPKEEQAGITRHLRGQVAGRSRAPPRIVHLA